MTQINSITLMVSISERDVYTKDLFYYVSDSLSIKILKSVHLYTTFAVNKLLEHVKASKGSLLIKLGICSK